MSAFFLIKYCPVRLASGEILEPDPEDNTLSLKRTQSESKLMAIDLEMNLKISVRLCPKNCNFLTTS